MQYCVVEYAYNGISCANSTVLIDNCTLRFNQYAGISCEFSSNPLIQHTALLSNGFAGIVCELRSNPVIQFCHILLNANGLVASDKSAPDLGGRRRCRNSRQVSTTYTITGSLIFTIIRERIFMPRTTTGTR